MNFGIFFKATVLFLSICKTVHLQDATLNGISTNHTIPCEKGWISFGQICYKSVMERATWDDASAHCVSLGGHLLSIHSKEEQDFITGYVLSEMNTEPFEPTKPFEPTEPWIGLADTASVDNFVWSDGSDVNYKHWSSTEPSNIDPLGRKEDCAQLLYNGQWNDVYCSHKLTSICKKERNESLSSPDPFFCSPEKGGGWKLRGVCYNLVNQKKSWQDAEQYCKDNYKGHLVMISDWSINWFLNYALRDFRGPVWIGIKLRDQLQQKWVSGWHVTYNFLPDDITSTFTEEVCILRSRSSTWIEVPCSQQYPFICDSSKENPIVLKNPLKGWKCPESPKDWRDLGGELCYYFHTTSLATWFEANRECARRRGHLASIHSQEEIDTIRFFILNSYHRMFIGLNSLLSDGNQYTWSDGTQLDYNNWYYGKPSSDNEKCTGIFVRNMKWHDVSCGSHSGYICSARKVPPSESLSGGLDESKGGTSTNIMTAEAFMHQSYCMCFPF